MSVFDKQKTDEFTKYLVGLGLNEKCIELCTQLRTKYLAKLESTSILIDSIIPKGNVTPKVKEYLDSHLERAMRKNMEVFIEGSDFNET